MVTIVKCKETKGFPCDDQAKAMKVIIDLDVMGKLNAIDAAANKGSFSNEWIVVLYGNITQGQMHVKDLFIPAQEVTHSTCEFDQTTLPPVPEGMDWLGTCHRHPGAMSSYSGQDSNNIFADHPLSIMLHDGTDLLSRITAYLRIVLPCAPDVYKLIKVDPTKIMFNTSSPIDVAAEVQEKIKPRNFRSGVTYVYGGPATGVMPRTVQQVEREPRTVIQLPSGKREKEGKKEGKKNGKGGRFLRDEATQLPFEEVGEVGDYSNVALYPLDPDLVDVLTQH